MKRGGYSVYRIMLHDSAKKDEVISKFLSFGTVIDQDGRLIAIAVPPSADWDTVVDHILEGKRYDFWGAQDGYVFEGFTRGFPPRLTKLANSRQLSPSLPLILSQFE